MVLENLKSQTRSQHAALERLNPLPGDRAEYVAMLKRFYGFVEPWEKRLADAVPADDALRAGRSKTAWLEDDLERMGVDATARSGLPRCERLPASGSRAALLGACYVFEGSTLGGQFITQHLRERVGVTPGEGDRYFNSYGREVGAKWQAFREELLRHSSVENDAEMIRAAGETFDRLAEWFAASTETVA